MDVVRVQSDSPVSRKAMVTIGNNIIPFYEATLHLKVDEFATLELRVPVDCIDLQALEENTKLVIDKRGTDVN